jgi:hypothetical protein
MSQLQKSSEHPGRWDSNRFLAQVFATISPRDADLAHRVSLRRFSNQPVAEIVQCGEPLPNNLQSQQLAESAIWSARTSTG